MIDRSYEPLLEAAKQAPFDRGVNALYAPAMTTATDGQTIFLTGGTGFVGSAVLTNLLAREFRVAALVNHKAPPAKERVTVIRGDLFEEGFLASSMTGCAAVIHLVGIIREAPSKGVTFEHLHVDATRAVVHAAERAGVKRYLHMSALGTRDNAVSEYHRTKFAAEQIVRGSSLDWTIFRPSMIHGPGGEFMQMVAGWARGTSAPFLFMPYFGAGIVGLGGAGKIQPVFVDDVARAFVDAINNPATIGKTYDLVGAEVMTWPRMHKIASRLIVGKERTTVPIPAWYAKLLTRIVPSSLLPFNHAQIVMSQEDNVGNAEPFQHDFGWKPGGFEATLVEYAKAI